MLVIGQAKQRTQTVGSKHELRLRPTKHIRYIIANQAIAISQSEHDRGSSRGLQYLDWLYLASARTGRNPYSQTHRIVST